MTATKNTTSTEVATVEEKLSPVQIAHQRQEAIRPIVLHVDEEVRLQILTEAAQAEAVVAFLGQKGSVAALEMMNSMAKLRQLFPAAEKRKSLLGPDACDLYGETDPYKKAMGEVNNGARKHLVSRLKRDGYLGDMAERMADDLLKRVRSSASLAFRRYVEEVALTTCEGDEKAAAALLLAHGFEHHTGIETKKAAQLIRPGQTVEVAEDTTAEGVRSVNGVALKVLNPAPKAGDKTEANEPETQSDQTTPNQTADAEIAEITDGKVTDPNVLINEAVGMLRTAAKLLANGRKMTLSQRNTHRKNIQSAVRTLVGELEGPMDADKVGDITAEVSASK